MYLEAITKQVSSTTWSWEMGGDPWGMINVRYDRSRDSIPQRVDLQYWEYNEAAFLLNTQKEIAWWRLILSGGTMEPETIFIGQHVIVTIKGTRSISQ